MEKFFANELYCVTETNFVSLHKELSHLKNSRKIIVIFALLRVAVQKTGLHPNTLRKYAGKGVIKEVRMSER